MIMLYVVLFGVALIAAGCAVDLKKKGDEEVTMSGSAFRAAWETATAGEAPLCVNKQINLTYPVNIGTSEKPVYAYPLLESISRQVLSTDARFSKIFNNLPLAGQKSAIAGLVKALQTSLASVKISNVVARTFGSACVTNDFFGSYMKDNVNLGVTVNDINAILKAAGSPVSSGGCVDPSWEVRPVNLGSATTGVPYAFPLLRLVYNHVNPDALINLKNCKIKADDATESNEVAPTAVDDAAPYAPVTTCGQTADSREWTIVGGRLVFSDDGNRTFSLVCGDLTVPIPGTLTVNKKKVGGGGGGSNSGSGVIEPAPAPLNLGGSGSAP
jgi:hypothetical protein